MITVEGLASSNDLHPIQQSFVENCAFQCGFCTPGFILMTKELLGRHPQPTTDEIRHYLSGNLCRCAAYPDIVRAVQAVGAEKMKLGTVSDFLQFEKLLTVPNFRPCGAPATIAPPAPTAPVG